MFEITVLPNDSNQTIINFLKKRFKQESLARIYHLFYKKKLRVNNKRVTDFKYVLQTDDVIQIYDQSFQQVKIQELVQDPNIPLKIIYEDVNILVVLKEHNVLVHSINLESLDNAVRFLLQKKKQTPENTFIISHLYRLDKLTQGLVLYPKTRQAQQILQEAQLDHKITKKYLAVCAGNFEQPEVVTGFINKDEINQKMVFSYDKSSRFAKKCQTIIKPILNTKDYSLVECELVTGRKHQIRASLSFLGHPVVGDRKYGANEYLSRKIMLFAYYLKFPKLPEPLAYLENQEIIISDLKDNLVNSIKQGNLK